MVICFCVVEMGNPHVRHSHHTFWNVRANHSTFIYNVTTTLLPDDVSNFTNSTVEESPSALHKNMYLYLTSVLILFCLISILANVVVLLSVCWIRTRISPTLHISLSLAAADTFTLFTFAVGLVINSLLPVAMDIKMDGHCFSLFLESFRMGGIITTLLHLLALAVNHYLGILSPLQYPSYMTRKKIHYCAFLMWTIPSLSLIAYFHFLEEAFSTPTCSFE